MSSDGKRAVVSLDKEKSSVDLMMFLEHHLMMSGLSYISLKFCFIQVFITVRQWVVCGVICMLTGLVEM